MGDVDAKYKKYQDEINERYVNINDCLGNRIKGNRKNKKKMKSVLKARNVRSSKHRIQILEIEP